MYDFEALRFLTTTTRNVQLITPSRALARLRFGRDAGLRTIISVHGGPRDGTISKAHSNDKAAICQRLAVNDVSEGRRFVPGSNSNEVARLP